MLKIERYRTLYGNPTDDINGITITEDGKANVSFWLALLLIHNSGLRSGKKRMKKKRLKRELMKAISRGLKAERE